MTTDLASTPWVASGFSDSNYDTIAQRVAAANNGVEVYVMGSLTTLGKVIPSTTGLQYGLGKEVSSTGFLDKYHGCRLVLIDPALVPGTVNTTATLIVPTGYLYFIGMGTYKPVKVVFEGQNVTVDTIASETPDKTTGLSITMRMGISSIVGSKFGAITGIS